MMLRMMREVAQINGVNRTISVYLCNLAPKDMVEYGHVLPQPGEEAAWYDRLPELLQDYLAMSVMQSACKHPERCVIGHPFNPPHIIPLVEVVAGAKTSETVQRALSFYTSMFEKKWSAMSRTVSKARCIGRSYTSSSRVCWMSLMPMLLCAGDLDCVGA
jgi:3-hydroxyacyl-CoA dehydrogenase, NAD binding domain